MVLRRLGMALLLFVVAACHDQRFTLVGEIDGLCPGDTLRFERIIHPNWTYEPAFDIIVQDSGRFRYRGNQPHDQHYLMSFHPKVGQARRCDCRGKELIITDSDYIRMKGSVDQIYYCSLEGGIYDDPLLAERLRLEDSLGMVRGEYMYLAGEALERKDTAMAEIYSQKFNLFYENNPGSDRKKSASRRYTEAHSEGTLYLLVQDLSAISYRPIEESKAIYTAYSPELQKSYYGQFFAQQMAVMEQLAEGQPGPDFTVTTVDGKALDKVSYAGRYLLIYHWGMCPGSIFIDRYVQELYDRYHSQGLDVLGITESIASIREIYEKLPTDKKTPLPGVEDIRPILADMLQHPWPEVEVETDSPTNKLLMETYRFSGWPFFVLIAPDGTIRARGFIDAFRTSQKVLAEELGERPDVTVAASEE